MLTQGIFHTTFLATIEKPQVVSKLFEKMTDEVKHIFVHEAACAYNTKFRHDHPSARINVEPFTISKGEAPTSMLELTTTIGNFYLTPSYKVLLKYGDAVPIKELKEGMELKAFGRVPYRCMRKGVFIDCVLVGYFTENNYAVLEEELIRHSLCGGGLILEALYKYPPIFVEKVTQSYHITTKSEYYCICTDDSKTSCGIIVRL